MGIVLKQTDSRSKYQRKIATELQDKLKNKSLESDTSDHVSKSVYLENTKQSNFMSKVWLILAFLTIIVIGILFYRLYRPIIF
jgi:predicted RND superfamily exporter protein